MFLNKTRAVKPLLNDTTCQSSVKNDSLCMGRPTSSSLCRPTTTCNSSVNNSRPSSSSCKATLQQEVDSDSDDEGVIELCTPSPMISSRPASSSRTQKSLLLANNIANKSSNLQPVPQPATLKPGSVKIPSPVVQPSLPIQHTTIVNPSPNRPPTSNGASFSQKPPVEEDSSSSEDEATPTMLQTNINTQSTRAMIPLIGADTTAGASNGNKNWGDPPKSIKDLSESSSSDSPLLTTPIYVKEVQEERIQTNMSVSPLNHISPGHSPRDYAGDWDDVPEIEEEELESSATSVAPPAKHNKPNAHSPPKKHDNHSPHHEHIPAKKRPISSRTPPSVSQETQAKTPNKASDSPSTPQSNNQLTANEPARPQTSGNWKLKFEDVELGEKLGSGGFGTVFKARSKQSGETVAVKMCICQDSDMVTAFKREIQMLSQLHHEHVVLFKGACVDPPHLCIVTELMCLGSLYDRLQDEDMDMPWTLRLRWTRDIARGMNYLHTLSPPIVHRDLKSPNVLVNDYYMIKLCDFGMSRTKNHTLVKTKQMGGSPMWMAPECLRGEPFTEKSDVYSFGVVMWEILTREVPWEDKEMVQLVGLVGFRNQTLEIPAHNPGCPNTYLDIMKSCWEAIASDRPSFQDAVPILEKLAISHR